MLPSVSSNHTLNVVVYSVTSCTHPSPGHNEVSKTDKSSNFCEVFILLGQTNNNKIMQFQITKGK